jgi:CRISPR-associated protein Csm2
MISLPQDYTAKAEQVITSLQKTMGKDYKNFTTSKIRNILAMVNEIYNDIQSEAGETLSSKIQNQIQYMKVRLVYECGREPNVIKPFVIKAELLEIIEWIKDSRTNFINFARYMEALVAYHRFYGGRDQ